MVKDYVLTRGIRNNNPFNLRRSANGWLGKLSDSKSTDNEFEQFQTILFGVRAGILCLLNGYIRKGFNTPELIISRFAPANENDPIAYLHFVLEQPLLEQRKVIDIHSLAFYQLCQAICKYESSFDLTYDMFNYVIKKFRLL